MRIPERAARPAPYFPGFNGVRALAACLVMIHHIEQAKDQAGLRSFWSSPIIDGLGTAGVNVFFALSGFLITYLLLEERQANGKIDRLGFYARRARRILPLYYAVMLIGFILVPLAAGLLYPGGDPGSVFARGTATLSHDLLGKAALFSVVLPNLALILYEPVVGAAQAWSIGYEEQFYLLWPWILPRSRKGMLAVFLLILFGKRVAVLVLFNLPHSHATFVAFMYILRFSLEYICVGALGAFLWFHHRDWVQRHLVRRPLQLLAAPILISFLCFGKTLFEHYAELGAVIVTLCLLNLTSSPYRGWNLESAWLNRLGRISYGIYMYHGFLILLVLAAIRRTPLWRADPGMFNAFLYPAVYAVTIAVAWVSWRFFEGKFQESRWRNPS